MLSRASGPFASFDIWYAPVEAWAALLKQSGTGRQQRGLARLARQHFAAADPHFAADRSIGGFRHRKAIVDVGAKGLKAHSPFAVPVCPRHFRPAEASRTGHANPLRSKLHRGLNRLLHRAAKRDPALELGRAVLRTQLGVGLRLAHLADVEKHSLVREALDGL